MPSVYDHLQVVLRAQHAMKAVDLAEELEKLRAMPAPRLQGDPLEYPLNIPGDSLEAVAIFTLLPPKSKTKGSEPKLPIWQRLVRRGRELLQTWVSRVTTWVTAIRWGWTVPLKMSFWVQSLIRAVEVSRTTDLYDAEQHDLQTMCVAKHLQGEGLGSAIMNKIQADLAKIQGAVGIRGLCQSESTRNFYAKSGFQAREVLTHTQALSKPGTLRKHYFVAWDVEHKISHVHKAE